MNCLKKAFQYFTCKFHPRLHSVYFKVFTLDFVILYQITFYEI